MTTRAVATPDAAPQEERAAEKRVGVVLLNLGGPDRPESVRPFLLNLFRDPDVLQVPGGPVARHLLAWSIATLRAPRVRKNYVEVGGSPLLARTRAQERALESRLNQRADGGHDGSRHGRAPKFVVRTAMRYWHPRADEAVRELVVARIDRLVALPLYPHECRATTGSSFGELQQVLARRAPDLPVAKIASYANDARYLDALARCIDEGLVKARAQANAEPVLLFSAHGLPQRIVDAGDPYLREIAATVNGVLSRTQFRGEHLLSFQSRAGPVKWIGPATDAALAQLGARGVKSVVIVPVSFVSDHIETVHEIDLLLAAHARAHGITTFVRSPALDVRDDFIDALAQLVLRAEGTPGVWARGPAATSGAPSPSLAP